MKEERDISDIIGVEYQSIQFKGKEGGGGGGKIDIRRNLSIARLNQSKVYNDAKLILNTPLVEISL